MIFLSAGHSPSAPGAAWKGFQEHAEAALWVAELGNRLGTAAVAVPTGTLGQKVAWINARANKWDIALEVHFNAAANSSAEGCETLYSPNSTRGKTIAQRLQNSMAEFFLSRGIKPGWFQQDKSKGPLAFLVQTRCAAVIIEPEFVYWASRIRERRSACCDSLAQALREFL